MKLKEFIDRLESIYKEHGDLDCVYVFDGGYAGGHIDEDNITVRLPHKELLIGESK